MQTGNTNSERKWPLSLYDACSILNKNLPIFGNRVCGRTDVKKDRNYWWDGNFILLSLVALIIIIMQMYIVHTKDTSSL